MTQPTEQQEAVVWRTRQRSGAAGRAPAADQPESVRNVVLVGHSGAGKTTLVEALLVATGTIQRAGRVEDGSTVSDFDEVEIRQQRSVNLTLAPLVHAGIKVNLLDTPGLRRLHGRPAGRPAGRRRGAVRGLGGRRRRRPHPDALGRVRRRRHAARGRDHQARPPARPTSTRPWSPAATAFGDSVAPLYLPVGDGQGTVERADRAAVRAPLRLLRRHPHRARPRPGDADRVAEPRGELIEGIIQESEDESLMDRYLAGEEIDPKVLIEDLEKAVARGSFYPVLAASSPHGIGMAELLEVMTQAFPAPGEHPLPAVTALDGKAATRLNSDPDGPLLAEVVKTTADPYVGRISLVRVFSGTLRPDVAIHVSGHGLAERGHADHDAEERVGALTSPLGKQQRPVPPCPAGDIVRSREADQRGDRGHAVGQGAAAADGALVDAGAAAAGGDHCQVQGGRGQAVAGAGAAGGRGPDAAAGEQPGDAPAGAVVHGRGARRLAARPAEHAVRGGGRENRAAGGAAGDRRGQGPGTGPQREADRGPR